MPLQMDFVRAIIDKGPHPSLTVVGDDWQSIYRFSGGKLELTTRFDELVGNYTPTMLQKTFRYNNSIANTAGQFVMENLREIDEVAYVRYASVYRRFEDVSAFADEVERLRYAKDQSDDTDQLSLLSPSGLVENS